MKRAYIRYIKVQPYGRKLYLFDDRGAMRAFVGRHCKPFDVESINDGDDGYTIHTDGSDIYVGVFDGEPGTLAHEMTHAAVFILEHAGIDVGASSGENLAYLIGYLVDECVQKILKITQRKTP